MSGYIGVVELPKSFFVLLGGGSFAPPDTPKVSCYRNLQKPAWNA